MATKKFGITFVTEAAAITHDFEGTLEEATDAAISLLNAEGNTIIIVHGHCAHLITKDYIQNVEIREYEKEIDEKNGPTSPGRSAH